MTPPSILIIDDEPNQRFMLEQALRSLGDDWVILTAANGQEGLERASQHTPDLIITDYHMPGMTGLDLITRIRAQGMRSCIILMTAYSSPDLWEAAQRLHVDHYLTKPVPLTLLRRVVVAALNQHRSAHDKT